MMGCFNSLKQKLAAGVLSAIMGFAGGVFSVDVANAADQMKLAVTTSFHNSGLAEVLLPEIKKDLDLEVQLLVVGTGQALKLGRSGDVDAILVHSKIAEEKFVADGFGPYRREVMYNDFVFIGPKADEAGIKGAKNAVEALINIANTKQPFASRGDDSGTHKKELKLWAEAGLDAGALDTSWYLASGSGMGATLNVAAGKNAYVLSDRASWLNFKNKRDLELLFAGDPVLFNQYAILPVSKIKHPHVKYALSRKLEDWLVSDKGQEMIGGYKLADETLFTPNAN